MMNEIKRVLRPIVTILMIPLFLILLGSGLFTIAGELAQDRHPAVLAAMSLVAVGFAVAGAIFGWKVTGGRKPGTTRRKAIIRGVAVYGSYGLCRHAYRHGAQPVP